MSAATVVTEGFGSFGSAAFVVTQGYGTSGVIPPTPPTTTVSVGGGRSGPAAKSKRWWRVGNRLYFGTETEVEPVWDAYLARKEGEDVELPKVKSKPAPRVVAAQKAEPLPDVVIPHFDYPAIDWRPLYEIMVRQRDMESAAMMARAIQRRIDDDEDDIETILLMLH